MTERPKGASTNEDILVLAGNACLSRLILEIERSFFGKKEDMTFAGSGLEAGISLPNREKALLLLGKRT